MLQVKRWQRINKPDEGQAVCFSYSRGDHQEPGFAICFRGDYYAYHNRCPHAGSTLDWVPGRFFSEDGSMLTCQTHGACFEPINGQPIAGPAQSGLELLPLRVEPRALVVPEEVEGRGV